MIRIRSLLLLLSPWQSGSTTLEMERHDGLPKGEERIAATTYFERSQVMSSAFISDI